jgi:hypothetical protein
MADVFSRAKRSDVMSRIRSGGNKDTELALVRLFRQNHIVGWSVTGHIVFRRPSHGSSRRYLSNCSASEVQHDVNERDRILTRGDADGNSLDDQILCFRPNG